MPTPTNVVIGQLSSRCLLTQEDIGIPQQDSPEGRSHGPHPAIYPVARLDHQNCGTGLPCRSLGSAGMVLSPSGNPPGGDAVLLVEKAPPICTTLHIAEHRLSLHFDEESPYKAILAERIGHVELTIRPFRHRPL